MTLSVITPTADRPIAFSLAEYFMARQTHPPDEWIVADGGQIPVDCTMGQRHLHAPSPPGPTNFATNLLRALAAASGEVIAIWEDDDHYVPTHLDVLVAALGRAHAWIAGDDRQRYYHVGQRCWRCFDNTGSSLCQSALVRSVVPRFEQTIRTCLASRTYGIDTTLWRAIPREHWALTGEVTAVGIKGVPGRAGLGIGHRPDGHWTPDPDLTMLRTWIGADAELYAPFAIHQAAR